MKKILTIVFATIILTACASGKYEVKPDGTTTIEANEFLTNQQMGLFSMKVNPDGTRYLSIKDRATDQTTGQQKFNEGVKMMLQGISEGAVNGLTP